MDAVSAPAGQAGPRSQALPADGIGHVSQCLRTLRSIRRFSTDPVSRDSISFVLDHARRAGSGSNRQPWRFIVVMEPELRSALGAWYLAMWGHLESSGYASPASPAKRQITTRARHLATHFADAPVVIAVCLVPGRLMPVDLFAGASVYPAVQNLLLAARAIGLGATLTTVQALCRLDGQGAPGAHPELYAELKQLLQLPEHAVPAALVPMGWPAESFGEGNRRPLREVAYEDRWGREWDAT